jgi:hypothetical protein
LSSAARGSILVRARFGPVRFLAVMQVHPVFDETGAVVKMQEGIAGDLRSQG